MPKKSGGVSPAAFDALSARQVCRQQYLKQLVPVQFADERSGVVVVGDIGSPRPGPAAEKTVW